jgi:cytochrome c-type biogenesis protein CcmE
LDRRRLKFVVLLAGIVASMGFLLAVGMRSGDGFAYYLTVSEFGAQGSPSTANVRINGKVSTGTIERHASGQEVTFVMTDGAASLAVRYRGIVPDTFVDDADVVVEGRPGTDGTFEAHTLLAKCPSKYESADGADGDGADRS